jgi:hypothetical protein
MNKYKPMFRHFAFKISQKIEPSTRKVFITACFRACTPENKWRNERQPLEKRCFCPRTAKKRVKDPPTYALIGI